MSPSTQMPPEYYVSTCPETNRQFLVEAGKDNNLFELKPEEMPVRTGAVALLEALREARRQVNELAAEFCPEQRGTFDAVWSEGGSIGQAIANARRQQ